MSVGDCNQIADEMGSEGFHAGVTFPTKKRKGKRRLRGKFPHSNTTLVKPIFLKGGESHLIAKKTGSEGFPVELS